MSANSAQEYPRRRAPLLVRLLTWLPGPWWAWVLAAVSLNPVMAAVVSGACGPRVPGFASVVFFSATCALAGWATAWAWRRIETLRPLIARVTGDPAEDPFSGAGTTAWPVALGLFAPLPYLASFASNCPRAAILGLYVTGSVAAVPLMNGFWMYAIVAMGLHQLGARPLRLEPFERDRSLGLRPLGSLAFGFYLLYAAINTSLTLFTSYGRLQLLVYLAGMASCTYKRRPTLAKLPALHDFWPTGARGLPAPRHGRPLPRYWYLPDRIKYHCL